MKLFVCGMWQAELYDAARRIFQTIDIRGKGEVSKNDLKKFIMNKSKGSDATKQDFNIARRFIFGSNFKGDMSM